MNLFSKVWNKLVDIYYNIYEWFYTTFSKTTHWKFELSNETVYCYVYKGKIYISLEDYRLMEKDMLGRNILKQLKNDNIIFKILP